MSHNFLMFLLERPKLSLILPLNRQPLDQERNLFPHAIRIDLIASTQLSMETSLLDMSIHHVFPQSTKAKFIPFFFLDRYGKVITRPSDETPLLRDTSNAEFPRLRPLRGNCISPLPLRRDD